MKQLIFILSCLFSLPAYCQVVAIENDKQNVFYIGMDNPITVAVAGYQSHNISITITDGTITGKNGQYVVRVEHPGNVFMEVRRRTSKGFKTIEKKVFRVKRFPDPTAHFAGKTGGIINTATARKQIAPSAIIDRGNECTEPVIRIDSCTIMVLRNNKLFFTKGLHNHYGVRFTDDDEISNIIKTLRGGDRLLIVDITCHGPDGIVRNIVPMEFTITDESEKSENEKK